MRTVLVTGAASWEGAQLVRRLHGRGDVRVVAVDEIVPTVPLPVPLHRASLDSLDFARWMLDIRPEVVVHLQTVDRADQLGEGRARETVVLGAQALFGALSRLDDLTKVVVKSEAAVYGTGPRHPTIAVETATLSGRSTRHQRALQEVERFVGDLDDELPGVGVVILRFAEAHGPTVDSPFSRLLRLPAVPAALGHDPLLQLLGPDDVVRCLEHAMDAPATGVFNVAPEHPLYLSQILRLSRSTRIPMIGFQLDATLSALSRGGLTVPEHTKDLLRYGRVLRTDRMRDVLGFHPEVTTRAVAVAA